MGTILAIAALVAALIAGYFAISAYNTGEKIKRYLRDINSGEGFTSSDGQSSIRDEIVAVVKESRRLESHQNTPQKQTSQQVELSTENFNMIVEAVLTALEDNKKKAATADVCAKSVSEKVAKPAAEALPADATQAEEPVESDNKAMPEKKAPAEILYASAYNAEKRAFYKIEKAPFDGVIYEIAVDADDLSKGTLNVYPGAFDTVVQCRDFLDFCCETSGSGPNIETQEPGTVINSNGNWQIENKLKVKFV